MKTINSIITCYVFDVTLVCDIKLVQTQTNHIDV